MTPKSTLSTQAATALEGVTRGPWTVCDDDPDCIWVHAPSDHDFPRQIYGQDLGFDWDVDARTISNALFIAAARDLVPDMAAENAALHRALSDLMAAFPDTSHPAYIAARAFFDGAQHE